MALGACGNDEDDDASAGGPDRVEVVASFYPMAEIATRVGGERVRVSNLTPAGVEPHDLELTSRQVDELEDADLVVYLGQGFQPAVAEIASRRGSAALDVLDAVSLDAGAFEALEAEEGHDGDAPEEPEEDHESESGLDPHFWLDPTLMAAAVDAVTDGLVTADPDGEDTYRANATTYKDELEALDTEFDTGLETCERREIVTSHAAFFYLARRYDLTQLPIAGVSPEAEPDADRLAELSDEIEAGGITTVFFEELVSPDVAEALAREAGVDTAVLSPIEGLSEEQSDAGKDYAAVMRDNLAALRDALGCQ
jgi:zinc transport system substrate-binding protein